jgi:hypothetical protein
LNDVIEHGGTVPIQAGREPIANIPIIADESNLDALVLFVQQFLHLDEVSFDVEKWTNILPSLSAWSSVFACYQPAFETFFKGMVIDLLSQNVGLARILLRVFPEDERLSQLIAKKVRSSLDEDGILLTALFNYFRPANELVDHID